MAGRVRRLFEQLRGWRSQALPGYSDNGYSVLLVVIMPLWLVPSVWLDRHLGTDWIALAAGFVWATALVVSIVVATRDDAREGTGRWYGKGGFFNTGSVKALSRKQTAGRIETAPTSISMSRAAIEPGETAESESESGSAGEVNS
jgi:hypothetical protein